MLCCAGCGLLFYLSIQSLWLALFFRRLSDCDNLWGRD